MKKIIYILIIFAFISSASAADITNITNIMDAPCPETVGGTNVVTLHPHYVDNWFSVYNNGHVTYQVYAYDYVGIHDPPYMPAFIGAIEPEQMGVLNNNASYYLYADYDSISDLKSAEKLKDKFNQWWLLILIGGIILAALVIIINRIIKGVIR